MYIAKAGQPIISIRAPATATTAPAGPRKPHAPVLSPVPSVSAQDLFLAVDERCELSAEDVSAAPGAVRLLLRVE